MHFDNGSFVGIVDKECYNEAVDVGSNLLPYLIKELCCSHLTSSVQSDTVQKLRVAFDAAARSKSAQYGWEKTDMRFISKSEVENPSEADGLQEMITAGLAVWFGCTRDNFPAFLWSEFTFFSGFRISRAFQIYSWMGPLILVLVERVDIPNSFNIGFFESAPVDSDSEDHVLCIKFCSKMS